MTGKYWREDTEQRKGYFENQFFTNAKVIAKQNGISFNSFLSRIKDFESFKESLKIAWSIDTSLSEYFESMDDSELLDFFERDKIQKILNLEIEEIVEETPDIVQQVEKETREYFKATFVEKKTGKTKKTFARESIVIIKGKKVIKFRDSLGHFVKKIK